MSHPGPSFDPDDTQDNILNNLSKKKGDIHCVFFNSLSILKDLTEGVKTQTFITETQILIHKVQPKSWLYCSVFAFKKEEDVQTHPSLSIGV